MTRAIPRRRAARLVAAMSVAAALLASSTACGYHLAGRGSNLPAHIHTIGVPPFRNDTKRAELGQRITEAVIRELEARGKYKVTSETKGADAVLSGSVLSWTSTPTQISSNTSNAQRVSVTLKAAVTFEDQVEHRVTWKQDAYTFTAEYQVIGDPDQYFDTELTAVETVAKDFARGVISAIVQGF